IVFEVLVLYQRSTMIHDRIGISFCTLLALRAFSIPLSAQQVSIALNSSTSVSAFAQSKIASDLAALPPSAEVTVIVRYHPSVKRIPLGNRIASSTAVTQRHLPSLNAAVIRIKAAD